MLKFADTHRQDALHSRVWCCGALAVQGRCCRARLCSGATGMHVASPAITQAKYAHLVLLKAQLPRQQLHYRACLWGQAGVLPSNVPHAATCSKLCDCCASLPACLAAPCAMFTLNHNQQKTAFAHAAYISVSSINVICMCAITIFLKRYTAMTAPFHACRLHGPAC